MATWEKWHAIAFCRKRDLRVVPWYMMTSPASGTGCLSSGGGGAVGTFDREAAFYDEYQIPRSQSKGWVSVLPSTVIALELDSRLGGGNHRQCHRRKTLTRNNGCGMHFRHPWQVHGWQDDTIQLPAAGKTAKKTMPLKPKDGENDDNAPVLACLRKWGNETSSISS